MMIALAALCFLCALVPAILFVNNLSLYREPPLPGDPLPAVSVLIPARNEAEGIADALHAVLASTGVAFEIIVMDDGSTDGTAEIVQGMAAQDPRVRLERAPALAAGWNGKQHACWAAARAARHPVLCFVDADVRLKPQCLARMTGFLGGKSLVSGFPQQTTGTFLEWMLLPLIHFVLLGFLPMSRMRAGIDPAFAAGCGQFMMVRRDDYFACGGHSGIKLTMHDGLRLPRLFREAGYRTDLADLTDLATCRMYTSASQVWNGLAKNATEGLADPRRIVPVSAILILGQVLPFVPLVAALASLPLLVAALQHRMFLFGISREGLIILPLLLGAIIAAWLPRCLGVGVFRQDARGALLHPVGILLLLGVQFWALFRKLRGGAVSWRDRVYTPPV